MKKILVAIAVLAFASTAMGAVGIEFGSNWYKPRLNPQGASNDWFGQGQNFTITWGIDNDIALGVYTEATMLNDGFGTMYPFNVNAIQIRKGIVKSVDVGLNVGSFYEDYNAVSGVVTDIFGEVTVLSGKGEKVEGVVKGQAGGRWADNSYNGGEDWSGWYINLLVGLLI